MLVLSRSFHHPLLTRFFALFLSALVLANPVFAERRGSRPPQNLDRPQMYPFNDKTSVTLQHYRSRLASEDFPVMYQKPRGEFRDLLLPRDAKAFGLYPFPVVKGYNQNYLLKRHFDFTNLPPSESWEHFGVEGIGVVNSVDFSKKNFKNLYLATGGSGIYRSTSGGYSWSKIKSFPRNDANSIIVDQTNTSRILVYSIVPTGAVSSEPALYYSKDDGKKWSEIDLPLFKNEAGKKKKVFPIDLQFALNEVLMVGTVGDPRSDNPRRIMIMKASQKNGVWVWKQCFLKTFPVAVTKKQLTRVKLKFNSNRGVVAIPQGTNDVLYRTVNGGDKWNNVMSVQALGLDGYSITAYEPALPNTLVVYLYKSNDDPLNPLKTKIARSDNGGGKWTITDAESFTLSYNGSTTTYDGSDTSEDAPYGFDGQDLLIPNKNNPSDFMVFCYMYGPFHTTDGGKTFTQTYEGFSDLQYLTIFEGLEGDQSNEAVAVTPLDLRVGRLRWAGDSSWGLLMMPTDQGLYFLQDNILSQSARKLYLAETLRVAVSKENRIYSGLWHVGSTITKEDGTIFGFNGWENAGYRLKRNNDGTIESYAPALNIVHGYFPDGLTREEATSDSVLKQAKGTIGWPIQNDAQYYSGQWYMLPFGHDYVRRFNTELTTLNTIPVTNGDSYKYSNAAARAVAFDAASPVQGGRAFLVVQSSDDHYKLVSVSSLGSDSWTYTALLDFDAPDADPDVYTVVSNSFHMLARGNRIVVYGEKGMTISTDGGTSFKPPKFKGWAVRAMAQDNCGSLYSAMDPDSSSSKNGGVYFSKDDGTNWEKLDKTGSDSKSFIMDLYFDADETHIFAGTFGEGNLVRSTPACQ